MGTDLNRNDGIVALLVIVAQAQTYLLAVVALLLAGVGMGFFGSTQSTLVMTSVPLEVRGRALGLLSTAIGVLPLGMIALGELAEAFGTRTAITASALTGALCATVWLLRYPQVLAMTAGAPPVADPSGPTATRFGASLPR